MPDKIIKPKDKRFQDLIGQRFNRLHIIEYAGGKNWICYCDCGKKCTVKSSNIKSGVTSSCGCFNREISSARAYKHGNATPGKVTSEYKAWDNMIRRCTKENHPSYYIYGGRGIKVSDSWLKSFENFINDMGTRPSKKHSIDRINNDGNYEPSNCRWATQKDQCRNRANTIYVFYKGNKTTLVECAENLGIKYSLLYDRFIKYQSIEEAILKCG